MAQAVRQKKRRTNERRSSAGLPLDEAIPRSESENRRRDGHSRDKGSTANHHTTRDTSHKRHAARVNELPLAHLPLQRLPPTMDDTGMELDGLTPVIAAGPRGVQGGLLERLEREALAEAAQATAAAAAAASAASAGPSQPGAYVPGAAAKARKQQQQQQAGPSSPSPSTSTIGSAAPAAATTTTSAQPNGATQGECVALLAIEEEPKPA